MRKHIFYIRSKIIPLLEICLGLVFLVSKIHSIYQYNEFLDKLPDGIKELISYELMRYGDLLVWTVSILTGSIYWFNKKIYWVFTQTLLCLLLLKAGISLLVFYDLHLIPILIYILYLCCISLFVILEVKVIRTKQIGSTFISNRVKTQGIIIAVIACIVYFFLEVMF